MTRTARKKKTSADEFADNSISEEEAVLATRRAFTFLTACAQGEIEGITIGERIYAARAVLEQAARVPRLMNVLLEGAEALSEDDLTVIAAALE
jgi:hypothetical protein